MAGDASIEVRLHLVSKMLAEATKELQKVIGYLEGGDGDGDDAGGDASA